MTSKCILALDFDGLLIDGLNECLLVSWNGHHEVGIDRFSDAGLAELPDHFIARFKHHRSFAKHLGHFYMAFQHDVGVFRSQREFDIAYQSLPAGEVESFVQKVSAYRALARQTWRERWLGYHVFYDGLADWLLETNLPACIVTAKDPGSVSAILMQAGIQMPPSQIYGECREKLTALQAVADQFDVSRDQVCFFDDNVLNARDALHAGFRAYWARWGYNAPEHAEIAQQACLPAMQLHDLITFGTEELTT